MRQTNSQSQFDATLAEALKRFGVDEKQVEKLTVESLNIFIDLKIETKKFPGTGAAYKMAQSKTEASQKTAINSPPPQPAAAEKVAAKPPPPPPKVERPRIKRKLTADQTKALKVFHQFGAVEIDESSFLEEIKSSYRKMAKKYHPDLGAKNDGAFKLISQAYRRLVAAYAQN